jgi:predicted peptidase
MTIEPSFDHAGQVSSGLAKGHPIRTASSMVIEGAGTKVSTAVWSGTSTASEFAAGVRSVEAHRTLVNYTTFETGTIGTPGNGGSAHMGTRLVAYTIPDIRDWIMRQSL